mgnify:CR=1 FL=1
MATSRVGRRSMHHAERTHHAPMLRGRHQIADHGERPRLCASVGVDERPGRRAEARAPDRIAHQLRATVMLLVKQLVGECGVGADVLNGRIEAAAELEGVLALVKRMPCVRMVIDFPQVRSLLARSKVRTRDTGAPSS